MSTLPALRGGRASLPHLGQYGGPSKATNCERPIATAYQLAGPSATASPTNRALSSLGFRSGEPSVYLSANKVLEKMNWGRRSLRPGVGEYANLRAAKVTVKARQLLLSR